VKIIVIGGTGLIGSKVVQCLCSRGHSAIAASPASGVNTLTGEGLDDALAKADVVVDVANSPSFEDKAVLEFFEKSGRNLLAAEKRAGVKHHVALSVVGTERLLESGYFRAKLRQEELIVESAMPYTIVRSTQFMEFVPSILKAAGNSREIPLSTAFIQPISSNDVANFVGDTAVAAPMNGITEIAGPDRFRLSDLVQTYLRAIADPRRVIANQGTLYFGAHLSPETLVPAGKARIGSLSFDDWMSRTNPVAA
jgi:uncharacterized protein YbjT (DUF2867 family)